MFSGSGVQIAWGAVFTVLLLVGCVTDLRSRRIPNELVVAILVTGWAFALVSADPLRSIGSSFAGMALGFAIWIGFYVLGAIGAGDVKLFSAAGAWLGPALTWRAALYAAVFGGVLAIVMLLLQKRLVSSLRRIGLAVSARTMAVLPDASDSAPKHHQLPYGVALAVGALVAAWFPLLS